AERLGQEILKGRRTQVYRLRKVDLLGMTGNVEMLLWVDVESSLPAKIVIRNSDPKGEMEIRFEEFVLNEPLDARLLSFTVPAGFQRGGAVRTPRLDQPKTTKPTPPDSAPAFTDGVLRYRVPARIIWNRQGTTITALLRDPESVPQLEQKPSELRQWDVATGR